MGMSAARAGSLPPDVAAARAVLAVCAHPDDESFGLGGVLGALAADGADIAVLCLTHGEASTLGAGEDLGAVRARELGAAAAALGVRRVELLDHPDGALGDVPLTVLAGHVRAALDEHRPDLVIVFDPDGVTGHPDHRRATEAALAASGVVPVIAWAVHDDVAASLNDELGTRFVGRTSAEVDVVIEVDRSRQRAAIACHASQCLDNSVLWRRLELQGDREVLRWLRAPRDRPERETASAAP
jgi:LmbE family N-acetylglucosaminyl deacetylase